MAFTMNNNAHLVLVFAATLLLAAAYSIFRKLSSPLSRIPGPFLARFSRIWYLKHVYRGNFHRVNIGLHQKYGPIVRIAPNQFSVDDPAAIKVIYGLSRTFPKAAWYKASGNPQGEVADLFTDLNPARHAANRRLVANLYSTSSLVHMESSIDECVDLLLSRINDLAVEKSVFNLQWWMQCCAFDMIGKITVAKRFGFLDQGTDKFDIFGGIQNYLKYATIMGIFNEWHTIIFTLMSKLSSNRIVPIASFTASQIELGKKERQDRKKLRESGDLPLDSLDFLSRTLELHERNPEKFSEAAVNMTCLTNIGAGSDTTSVSLSSILYNIYSHPNVLSKLRYEIDQKLVELGHVDRIPFKNTQSMPYLQACIKEALRIHPATGLPLARVVPEGGATICGIFFPVGSVVGINTWVIHRNADVFGRDSDIYRPERWLDQSKERLSLMESCWIPFGAGSRTCIGKNISLLEINKIVPCIVKHFDLVPCQTEKLKDENVWFVKQVNMMCRASIRDK